MGKERLITLELTREQFAEMDALIRFALAANCLEFCAASRKHPLDMSPQEKRAFDTLRDETTKLQDLASVITATKGAI